MSYVDWNQVLGEVDLDFLRPLMDEVSKIYDEQWKTSSESLMSGDPYGSSLRDQNMADAFQKYNTEAAREKSNVTMQYFDAMQTNRLKGGLEDMEERYQQMQDEYEEYKKQNPENRPEPENNMDIYSIMNAMGQMMGQFSPQIYPMWFQTPGSNSQSGGSGSQQGGGSSMWPPGGTILNPEVLTNYHPFDNPPTSGSLPGGFSNTFYPQGNGGGFSTGNSGSGFNFPSVMQNIPTSTIPWWNRLDTEVTRSRNNTPSGGFSRGRTSYPVHPQDTPDYGMANPSRGSRPGARTGGKRGGGFTRRRPPAPTSGMPRPTGWANPNSGQKRIPRPPGFGKRFR